MIGDTVKVIVDRPMGSRHPGTFHPKKPPQDVFLRRFFHEKGNGRPERGGHSEGCRAHAKT